MKNRYSLMPEAAKGWGYFLAGLIMNLWFCSVMIAVTKNYLFLKLLVGIAALVITNGLYFNYAYNCAKRDRDLIKYHGVTEDKNRAYKLAALVPIYSYVTYILLFLAKLGVFGNTQLGNYAFNYFVILNAKFVPWVNLFTEEIKMSNLTWGGMAGILLIILIEPLTIALTYKLTSAEVDVAQIMYKKKK